MKTIFKLMLIPITLFCLSGTIQAQVTIGMDEEPLNGALLQLKTDKDAVSRGGKNASQGLVLPRVLLSSLTILAGDNNDLKATIDNTSGAVWDKAQHIGLTVYNVAVRTGRDGSTICPGVYVWYGDKWYRLPKPCTEEVRAIRQTSSAEGATSISSSATSETATNEVVISQQQ